MLYFPYMYSYNGDKVMRSLKWVFWISLSVLLLVLATFKIEDFDTMQYLLNGKIILTQGLYAHFCSFNYFPHTCQLEYTHEWLFNVVTYILYQIGQWYALEFFQILTIVAIFSTIVVASRLFRYSSLSTGIFIFLALLVGMERFMLRTDLIGMLCFVLFYTTFRYYIEGKQYEKKGLPAHISLAIVFVIQIIWVNTHGSFPLAFVVVFAYILSYLIQTFIDYIHQKAITFTSPRFNALLLLFFITLVASMINPYGIHVFFDAFNTSQYMVSTILEWQSPFIPINYVSFSVVVYKILLIFSIVIILINGRKIRLIDICILSAFIYLSVQYVRDIALFAVFCAMILPYYLDEGMRRMYQTFGDKKHFHHSMLLGKQLIMALLIVLSAYYTYQIVTNTFYLQDEQTRLFGIGLSETQFPIGATNFIKQHDLRGNMFNDFSIGAYLNWRFYPLRKTFIDGKTFTPQSLGYYNSIMLNKVPYTSLVKKYGINYFILNHISGDTSSLIDALYSDKKWVLVYFDERSVIFVANTPENKVIIDTYAINFKTNKHYNPNRLPTFTDPVDLPYGFTQRGALLYDLGLYKKANYEFQKAVAFGTNYYSEYLGLGNSYAQLGQLALAQNAYQKAVEMAPSNASTHYNLGVFYANSGEYDQALQEFNDTLSINSRYPNVNSEILDIYESGK